MSRYDLIWGARDQPYSTLLHYTGFFGEYTIPHTDMYVNTNILQKTEYKHNRKRRQPKNRAVTTMRQVYVAQYFILSLVNCSGMWC